MTKLRFILSLNEKLKDFPQNEVEEYLNHYSKKIDEKIAEGLSEEEAVQSIGSVEETASRIAAELSPLTVNKPHKEIKAWEITLLIVSSPIWLSLLIAAISIVFSLYISLWSVIISLWAIFGTIIGCAIGGVICGTASVILGYTTSGIAIIGAVLVCAGLAIFFYYGCTAATSGVMILTKKTIAWVKKCFTEKEKA